MEAPRWRTDLGLGDALCAEPHTFELFQAVRLLTRAAGDAGGSSEPLPIGIRSVSDQAFPSGEIRAVEFEPPLGSGDIEHVVIDVARTGLVGPRGPLPTAHAEWVLDEELEPSRSRGGRAALPAFLDLFSQRLTSLEYRGKESSCLALESRRPQASRLGERLFCLMGLRHYAGKYPVPQGSILAVAGLLADRRPSKARLQKVLRTWLGVPVEVSDHVGGWRDIDPAQRTELGRSTLTGSQVLGTRVWLQQGAVDVTLSGISYAALLEYVPKLPERRPVALEELGATVGLLTELRWPTRLTLTTPWKDVPRSRLFRRWRPRGSAPPVAAGGHADDNPCMLLGRTSWLKGRSTDAHNPATGSHEVSTTLELNP